MTLSLKTEHLKRYKDILWLLIRHGRSDLSPGAPPEELRAAAERLTSDLESMGPAFIKLGQVLSTRADLLPEPYLEALSRLQDSVEPFPFSEVEQIVQSELGVRLSKAFAEFDPTPIAAASLGQVHRARMRDGRLVAVKVQRPQVRERVLQDVDALLEAARFLDAHTEAGRRYEFHKLFEELRSSLLRELDYRQEASHLETLGGMLVEFERIVVPAPVLDYTSERVLTMDHVRGKKVTALTPLTRMEIDGTALAEDLFRAYLEQILVDGFFHADPHPGNVFLTDDGRIALIDLGMVAHVTPAMQDKLLQLLLAISEGRGEDCSSLAIRIGSARDSFDEPEFRRRIASLVSQQRSATLEQLEIGKSVLHLTRTCGECGLLLPPELALLGKTLLNLDQVGRTLDPSFDPNAAVQRNALAILRRRIAKSFTPGNLFVGLLDWKDAIEHLPRRIARILERVADNDLEVRVDAIDEERLLAGLQKIANRITLGLVLAALIVGAAMLMNVPTSWRILGYPGLAIIFFVAAAGGGVLLMTNILVHDVRPKE